MILYKLFHKYKLDDHYENKDIGIYSSRNIAESAINDLKKKRIQGYDGWFQNKKSIQICQAETLG